jgi:regulator of RNase E activity RraA
MCVPRERAEEVVKASRAREQAEAQVLDRLTAGETTLDVFGWY